MGDNFEEIANPDILCLPSISLREFLSANVTSLLGELIRSEYIES